MFGLDKSNASVANPIERWVDAPGYAGLYEVSDRGRVRALVASKSRRRKVMKVTRRPDGYSCVGLYLGTGRVRNWLVHRLVLTAFLGPAPGQDMQAAHLNGNRADNRLANLIWATVSENHSHKRSHGTNGNGETNAAAKLTEAQVMSIRSEFHPYSRTNGSTALGRKYGITPGHVCAIVNRERWTHI